MEEKDGGPPEKPKAQTIICIDASKRETHHAGNGFKKLFRRLRSSNYKPISNKEDLTPQLLGTVDVLVVGAPRERFTADELRDVKEFVANGGSLLVLSSEGGEPKLGCNVNELLEGYGMSAQPDSVLRTVYYKYLHPKEVFVSHGVLQPELATHKHLSHGNARKHRRGGVAAAKEPEGGHDAAQGGGLSFVYPRGATLSVQRPARAVLSSGAISYPIHRTVCAAWEGSHPNGGTEAARVVAAGAVEMFSDEWLDKEENGTLCDLLFRWLARDAEAPSLAHPKDDKPKGHHHHHKSAKNRGGAPSPTDGKHHHHHHHHKSHVPTEVERGHHGSFDPGMDTTFDMSGEHHHAGDDAAAYARVPDIEALASRLRACLQENDELPRNFTRLFNDALFRFDTDVIPEVVALYEQLHVKHEALSLIPPSFEYPLPPLQPATFPPALREPPSPPLDQFDLDEHFASKRERLAQLTNKCIPGGMTKKDGDAALAEPDDLEYYVREAGEIVGATAHLAARSPENALSAKHVLAFVLNELVTFKKVNPTEAAEVDHTRRAGAEDTNPQHRSAGTIIASTEPIKKRAQLTHLSAYDADAKDAGPAPSTTPRAAASRPPRAAGPCRAGLDDGARPPLRAFGGEDDVAESKSGGDTAEVMTFK
ncbi:hypothetical protein JL720_4299 [Aureococcus anophagefferens]|nr:hypothetical protein JL720_4299 [Aureococcus anophagefferens]